MSKNTIANRPLISGDSPLRLSRQSPEEFGWYYETFIRYARKYGPHIKRGYDGGFFQPKSKKTGRPLFLTPEMAVEAAEHHLDREAWAAWKEQQPGVSCTYIPDLRPYWVGLHAPRRVRLSAIDYDAKRYTLALFKIETRRSGIPNILETWRPLVVPSLQHFADLKRLYDAFPRRIWCVSSATLGLHAWRHHGSIEIGENIGRHKAILDGIGMGSVEVHPMPGRVFRRPFGMDYLTMTPDGVMTDWRDQIRYFMHDRRTPSFERIVGTLLGLVRFARDQYVRGGERNLYIEAQDVLPLISSTIGIVEDWLADGCPELEVPSSPFDSPPPRIVCKCGVKPAHTSGLYDRYMPLTLEKLARDGLQDEDTFHEVVFNMAKHLFWVELFDMEAEERKAEVLRLIELFVATKHNGKITRLEDAGRRAEVCVNEVATMEPNEATKQVFALTRQKLRSRAYRHPINLSRCIQAPDSDSTLPLLRIVYKCGVKDDHLPAPIEARLARIAAENKHRKRNGEYPFIRFSRRFLNALWDRQGTARINRETLLQMSESRDPHQQLNHKKLLVEAKLLQPDWERSIRRLECAAKYSMTAMCRAAFEERYQQNQSRETA